MENSLLSRKETAALLKITLSTLWRWTRNGKLKSYYIGSRVYYLQNEVMSSLNPREYKYIIKC